MADPLAPTGLARRARRLPEDETERRMLRAALAMVNRAGLTVSLEHISFEEVIREADVSRSSAYRRWPHKDLFFSDLVLEVARNPAPGIFADEVDLIRRIIAGGLRSQVQAALARAEQDHLSRVARAWQLLAGLLGFRLRQETGGTFETLAALVTATMRGLVMTALTVPDIAGHRTTAQPFGTPEAGEWSLPALGLGAIAIACLEPDPDFTWDEARATAIRAALTAPDLST
jgi:AcrR family transcriptional regulator